MDNSLINTMNPNPDTPAPRRPMNAGDAAQWHESNEEACRSDILAPVVEEVTDLPIIDMTRSRWGHNVEVQWGSKLQPDGCWLVYGCLTPLPKVGQLMRLKTGKIVVFREVAPWRNPPDGFEGKVQIVNIIEE